MRRRLQRAAAFLLVPLSALPLVAIAPIVAPSVQRRVDELRGTTRQQAAPQAPALGLEPVRIDPVIEPIHR
jgi:hypothetical protein